jgi:hypothetical protein
LQQYCQTFLNLLPESKNSVLYPGLKKSKLIIEYNFDFDLLGITTSAKSYKLAWELNHMLAIRLVKQNDIIVGFKNNIERTYSFFTHQTAACQIKLFRNKPNEADAEKHFLVPEYPHFDYIMMFQCDERPLVKKMLESIKQISSVELATFIPLADLKSKENFIF